MARITVEDCLENVDNRFQLVLVATRRARQIARGAETHVPIDNDKPTVVALREIAEGFVTSAILDEPEFMAPELEFGLLDEAEETAEETAPDAVSTETAGPEAASPVTADADEPAAESTEDEIVIKIEESLADADPNTPEEPVE